MSTSELEPSVMTGIGALGLLLILVWLVVMGVVMLRLREPVA